MKKYTRLTDEEFFFFWKIQRATQGIYTTGPEIDKHSIINFLPAEWKKDLGDSYLSLYLDTHLDILSNKVPSKTKSLKKS